MTKLLKELGEPVDEKEIEKLIREADLDGANKISQEGKIFFSNLDLRFTYL